MRISLEGTAATNAHVKANQQQMLSFVIEQVFPLRLPGLFMRENVVKAECL